MFYHAEAPTNLQLSGFHSDGLQESLWFSFSRGGTGGLYYLSFDEANSTASWLPVKAAVGAYTKPGGSNRVMGFGRR